MNLGKKIYIGLFILQILILIFSIILFAFKNGDDWLGFTSVVFLVSFIYSFFWYLPLFFSFDNKKLAIILNSSFALAAAGAFFIWNQELLFDLFGKEILDSLLKLAMISYYGFPIISLIFTIISIIFIIKSTKKNNSSEN